MNTSTRCPNCATIGQERTTAHEPCRACGHCLCGDYCRLDPDQLDRMGMAGVAHYVRVREQAHEQARELAREQATRRLWRHLYDPTDDSSVAPATSPASTPNGAREGSAS